MSKPSFQEPEQDQLGDGNLPTYDEAAAQQGPNSRFGRWRSWIEKRAAERYADVTPAEAARRMARGWGQGVQQAPERDSRNLHLQTDFQGPPPNYPLTPPQISPPPFTGEPVPPTHLRVNQFGSRFLPHSTQPIRCILPLLSDRLILIGHDDGLSVLNMYPKEWTEHGLSDSGPTDAVVRAIWVGEPVYQLSLLELDETGSGSGTPSGVVLVLIGSSQKSDCPKDMDTIRTLRMYSLSSLVSLAKWTASNKYTTPLDLGRSMFGNQPKGSSKRNHKAQTSFTKGLKSLGIESPISATVRPFDAFSSRQNLSSTSSLATAVESEAHGKPHAIRNDSNDSADSSWDVVEDLPLRWASDYVPLATAGSRLANTNVLFYETWSDENLRGRKGSLLAVGTKSAILLYETPKGERAFRFVKEFYTPLTPRGMRFVHQALTDPVSRSTSDAGPSRTTRTSPSKMAAHIASHQRSTSTASPSIRYPNQLSLFVTFEKKSGLIRVMDSSVGEVELYDETSSSGAASSNSRDTLLPPGTGSLSKRNRASWDGFSFMKEKSTWILPERVDLSSSITRSSVYLLTRSKRTHIVPYPFPAVLPATPSFRVFIWSCVPKHVQARVCRPLSADETQPPFLQLIAFGDDGVEVQEVPLHSLTERKGKSRAVSPVQGMADFLGGETGPLCVGGQWHQQQGVDLARNASTLSYATATSFDSYETDELAARFRSQQGIYGWVRKGMSDWRVFWVGGDGQSPEEEQF